MKLDPESLMREVEAARNLRDSHLAAMDDMVRRMCQRDYRGWDECDFAPENHEFEYVSLMLPKLVFTEPRVRVRCRTPGPGRREAVALKHALNQWGAETCLAEVMQDVARDYLFNYGVYYTSQEPMPGYGDNPAHPHWPRTCRLSQKQFLLDPLCGIFRHARWAGHEYAIEKEQLIQLAIDRPELGWDVAMLEDLATTTEFEWRSNVEDAPDREEFRVIRMWVPDAHEDDSPGPEAGYHGTWYTLISGQDMSAWVRRPIPAFVPRWGPYALAGAYSVPDSPWPLGPLTAHKGRVDELNAHAIAASKAMAEYKRLVLVSASHPELGQMLKRPDMYVIPVKGLNKDNIIEVEIGGLKPEHIQALSLLRDRLDRVAGMSDAQRGNTDSGVTATADAIANESSSVRIAYLKQRHIQALRQVYQTAGWYFLMDDRVVDVLDDEAAAELGMPGAELYYVGGAGDPTSEIAREAGYTLDPDSMIFEIEPFSMDFVGQGVAKQQFLQALQVFTGMAQAMPMMPHVRWKDLFTKLGDAFNDEDWEDMVNADVAAMMGGLPGAMPSTPTPMFASLAGAPGGMGAPNPGPGVPGLGGGMGELMRGATPGAAADRNMLMQGHQATGRMAGQMAAVGRARPY